MAVLSRLRKLEAVTKKSCLVIWSSGHQGLAVNDISKAVDLLRAIPALESMTIALSSEWQRLEGARIRGTAKGDTEQQQFVGRLLQLIEQAEKGEKAV